MAKQNKTHGATDLKELKNKIQRAIKRLGHSIDVHDQKYSKELADYERLYGKYEGD